MRLCVLDDVEVIKVNELTLPFVKLGSKGYIAIDDKSESGNDVLLCRYYVQFENGAEWFDEVSIRRIPRQKFEWRMKAYENR